MTPSSRDARLLRAAIGRDGPTASRGTDVVALLDHARSERAVPLLHLASLADREHWDADALAQVHDAQLGVAMASVQIERAVLDVARELDDAGTTYALLKGVATAHLDYPDPAWRQFGDVDLLVSPRHLAEVRLVLERTGWRQGYVLPQHHEPFTHAVTFQGPTQIEIDLHQRIARRALGLLVPTDEILARRVPFTIAGQQLWALDEPCRFVHACLHMAAARGPYLRLSSVADVLLLSYYLEDDAASLMALADRWRVGSLVARAVSHAWERAQLPLPAGWGAALATPRRSNDRLVDRTYGDDRRHPIGEEIAYLRLMAGTRDRLAYLWGYVAVGDEYRAQKSRRGLRAQTTYLARRIRSR